MSIKNIMLIILAINYILMSLLTYSMLKYLFLMITLIIFVMSLLSIKGASRVFSYFMFFSGLMLMIDSHVSVLELLSALTSNAKLIILYVAILLLVIPLNIGDYQRHFNCFFRKHASGKFRFYFLSSLLTYILSLAINIGAQHIVCHITNPKEDTVELVGKAITRGSSCAIYWAPSMMALPVILGLTNISYLSIFPYALVLSLISLILCWAEEFLNLIVKKDDTTISGNSYEENVYCLKKIYEFIGAIILVIVSIMLVLTFSNLDIFTVIALVAFSVSVVWAMMLRKPIIFLDEVKKYGNNIFPKIKNEAALFLAAGFFGASIEYSGYSKLIPGFLASISGQNTMVFILLTLLLVFITSIIGVHPIIPVVALLSSVDPGSFGLSKLSFALLCLAGWSIGSSVSPLSGNNITAAGVLKVSSFKIALQWNLIFSFLAVLVLSFVIKQISIFI